MGTGERASYKKSSKGQMSKRNAKSDDSDEDYMLEEDELDDETDEFESLDGDASDEESLGDSKRLVGKVVRSTPRKRSVGKKKKEISKSSKRRKRISYSEEENDVSGDDGEESDCGNDFDSSDDDFKPDNLDFLDEDKLPYSKGSIKKKIGSTDDDEFNPDISDEENLPSSKRRIKKKSDSDDDDFKPDDHDILDEEELSSSKVKDEENSDTDDDEFNPDDIDLSEDEEDLPSLKGKRKKKHDTDDDELNSDDLEILGKCKRKSDTDDDEFYPDDLEFLDEEEDFPCSNKKRGPYSLKIKPKKKKRKRSSTSAKSTSGKSRKLKSKVPSSKRLPKRRKKNAVVSSDSDFASFESSDHEFTISEEEREQVREANELFQRETSYLRCVVKRDQEILAYKKPRKLLRRKGKEKVQEVKVDVAKQVCGICLTKEGKNTIRGTLNCCNHFFCCACITEWSKVESRCPLCKQRFTTISKCAESAPRIDLRDVVLSVPERDQVYQPSEEELRRYLDPYENVLCTECHEGGDDALMLLCDLCDSPAHTYCVGLGHEVPDGNWYCEGCRPSALGFTTSHTQDYILPSERPDNPSSLNEPLPFENMVEIDLNITAPETPLTPVNGFHAPPPLSGVGVSTLSGRRRAHRMRFLLSSNRSGTRVDDRSGTTDVGALYHGENPSRVPSVGFMQFGQVNSVPGYEWLQPCTSRMNLGSSTSMSPLYNGDVDQNTAKQQLQ